MTGSEPNPRELATVARCETLFAAQTIAAILEDSGIRAMVFAGERSGFGASSVERSEQAVPVLVAPEDAAPAREILAEAERAAGDLESDPPPDEEQDHLPTRKTRGRGALVLLIAVFVVLLATAIVVSFF